MSELKRYSNETTSKETKEDDQTVLKEWAKKIMKEAKKRERMMG
ncbi:MAG: hypothetical protein QE164_07245 [Candidatus Nezhaarchaeota archaeon]|nr:hypothetical protein [Candidatus Nezhaarchaeota archaeon]